MSENINKAPRSLFFFHILIKKFFEQTPEYNNRPIH